ncbi:MAG: hypothetical protein VX210_01300 [Myxococcota bacterium]|nr:hypothetical protein [Myxococcota bacterium]
MSRPYLLALLTTLMVMGCSGTTQMSEPPALPMPVVMLDDDDLIDCDLCRRGLGGENLWCDETQQGYVGGEVVSSYACFECKSAGTQVCESCDEPSSDVDRAACVEKNFNPNTESSDCEGDA